MFRKAIKSTPLTSDAANSHFGDIITGDPFGEDVSFLATLRALVGPRIKEGETIHLTFRESSYSARAIGSLSASTAIKTVCKKYDGLDNPGIIIIHSFIGAQEDTLANMRLVETTFTECYPEYHRLQKVKDFYRKSFNVDCYIDSEHKAVVIFVDNLDNKKQHYLQVSILAFLPWYFNPEDGASDIEMGLLYSLRETSSAKYEACLAKIADSYDFRSSHIRRLLKGFETRYQREECKDLRSRIGVTDVQILSLNEQIGKMLGLREDYCIRLLGLERKIAEGGDDSEIMEYFLCNRKLVLEAVDTRNMYFAVKDYLTYFDGEMAERIINNPRSFMYLNFHNGGRPYPGVSAEQIKELMRELFTEESPRLRVKFCAAYSFNLNGSVQPIGGHSFGSEFSDCMPNPHINSYRCMGNYLTTINRLLKERNYIGALEQCVASCKSLNLGDSTVASRFMSMLWGESPGNNCCIELPDGRVVKPIDAIEWLEQQVEA